MFIEKVLEKPYLFILKFVFDKSHKISTDLSGRLWRHW